MIEVLLREQAFAIRIKVPEPRCFVPFWFCAVLSQK
jgi:hypothetical protein